jgi:hypothetical protein
MSTTITGKLNKAARSHGATDYTIFFISIGTQLYDKKTKEKVWTNYDVALFAKGGQVQFYQDSLIEGAIVSVSGTGLILRMDENGVYEPKLELQDAKIEYINNGQQQQQSQGYQQPQQQSRISDDDVPRQKAPAGALQAPENDPIPF